MIASVLEKHKQALRMIWHDRATVVEYKDVLNPNHTTTMQEVVTLENEPCKLSFETLQSANQTNSTNNIYQRVKLFIDPDVVIKPGSKVIIKRRDKELVYKSSGEPAPFTNHQEILLELFDGWA